MSTPRMNMNITMNEPYKYKLTVDLRVGKVALVKNCMTNNSPQLRSYPNYVDLNKYIKRMLYMYKDQSCPALDVCIIKIFG